VTGDGAGHGRDQHCAAEGRRRQDNACCAARRGLAVGRQADRDARHRPAGEPVTWFNLRRRRLGDEAGGLVVQGLSGWRLGSELRRFRDEFDHILVDAPPHAEIELKTAIREADLALLPCQPNALDVWATKSTLEYARSERTEAMLVLNRMPARGRAAGMIRAEIEAAGWPLAATSLGNRQAFAASIGEGRGVAETAPASPAGQEIAALAQEVLARVG
jgi:chromosome partitioning protein